MMRSFGLGTFAVAATIASAGLASAQTGSATNAGAPGAGGGIGTNTPSASDAPAANSGSGKIEEVVVTAQRRAQSVQKAALTIQVISPKTLANAGITSPTQLTSIIPKLQVGNQGPATSVYVRGVGSYVSTAGQSPAVPYYTDGVYVARSQSVPSEFYDVDRLEVLIGPQGTLYGRNATGGAINIITRDPKLGSFSGYANMELGNYNDRAGDFAVNLPISPTVAVRVSAQIVDKGGYSSDQLGDDVHESGRIKLLWKPNADMRLLLNTSYGHISGYGPTWAVLNQDVPGWYPWLDASDPRAQAYTVAHALAPIPGFVRPSIKSDAGENLNFYNASAQFDWNLGPATLTILPAFRYSSMRYSDLFSFTATDGDGFGTLPRAPETSKAESVEARLSGNGDRLKWVAGLFFFNEDQFQQYGVNVGLPDNIGVDASYGTRSYAAFGQATYTVLPHFRLIGGLRYTSDNRTLTNGTAYVVSPTLFLGPPPVGAGPCGLPAPTQPQCVVDQFAGNQTFTNVSWKGGFEADVLQDSLLYGTASRGFKAGGFNDQSEFGHPGIALPFQPETLTSYEVGLKNRFLNNRLQLNVSGFYWDYKNHQEPHLGFTNAGTINNQFFNAGAATIYGGDVDVVARPWTGATVSATVEYAHSVYDSFAYTQPSATFSPGSTSCKGSPSTTMPGFTNVDCSGFETIKTPRFSGGVNLTQVFELPSGRLIASATTNFASARWLAIDFLPIERAAPYVTQDATLTYELAGGSWSVTGFVRNANDGRVYTQAQINPLSSIVAANINAPRTYGARLSYQF